MIKAILRDAGFRPKAVWRAGRGWLRYRAHRREFRSRLGLVEDWPWGRELPILSEWDEPAGSLGVYFHQDLLVARWVRENEPTRHVDIGSRIDGFVAHLAVFREVEVLDIRPVAESVEGVVFHQLDLMDELPGEWIESTDSLSCLHTIEHFGLGRYGDRLDPCGHERGLEQLKAMVKPGGRLYLSTPVGRQRIEFNAHRVFSPSTVIEWFIEGWEIERSAVFDEANRLSQSGDAAALQAFHGELGLGALVARKRR